MQWLSVLLQQKIFQPSSSDSQSALSRYPIILGHNSLRLGPIALAALLHQAYLTRVASSPAI